MPPQLSTPVVAEVVDMPAPSVIKPVEVVADELSDVPEVEESEPVQVIADETVYTNGDYSSDKKIFNSDDEYNTDDEYDSDDNEYDSDYFNDYKPSEKIIPDDEIPGLEEFEGERQAELEVSEVKVAKVEVAKVAKIAKAETESSGKQVSAEGEKEFYRQFQIELKNACRDNIRDNDGMFVSDLAMKEEWESPKEIANAIKSCYAYIINDMNPIYFKKSKKTIRYSDHDSVDVIYYNQSKVSSRDTSEQSTTFKIKYCSGGKKKVIQTSLNKLLGNWRPIAYAS